MSDLAEKLRRAAQHGYAANPGDHSDLLREAAAALEAAREDAERLDWLDANGGAVRMKENARRNLIIWNAVYVPSCRTIRAAIDQARGKGANDEA